MKKILFIVFVLVTQTIYSQENLIDWADGRSTTYNAQNANSYLFTPKLYNDKIIVSDSISFPDKKEVDIFSSLLFYIVTTYKNSRDVIYKIDAPKFKCATKTTILSEKYNGNGTFYEYKSVFHVKNNKLIFQLYDISVSYMSGIMPKYQTMFFESIMPDLSPKKDKNITYLSEFINGYNLVINKMVDYIKSNPSMSISHWNEINNRKVIVGMNFQECTLSIGCPLKINTTKIGGSINEQWIYEDRKYLYFENGILTSMQY